MMNIAHFLTILLTTALASPSLPEAKLPGGKPPEAKLPKTVDLSLVRSLVVQSDGRWMPLDTLARDLVHEVTGHYSFRDREPLTILLAWTFDPATWMQQPMMEISNAELRSELGLPAERTMFSFTDLVGDERLLSLIDHLKHRPPGAKPDPLESKVSDINEKLLALQTGFGGQSIHLIPNAEQEAGPWKAIPQAGPASPTAEAPAREAWGALGKAFMADDAKAFAAAAGELRKTLAALPAKHRPGTDLIQMELHYNDMQPFQKAWIIMAIAAALAGLAMAVRQRWFDFVALVPLAAGFGVTSYGLWLRWQLAGHIPASNMYESLLFLGWGMGLFAILTIFVFRQPLVLLTASGMAALALFLSDILPLDPFIRPTPPVLLDTYWMAIHVPIIMVSYSVLALGVLIAHAQLAVMAIAPRSRATATAIDALHYWYIHVGSILLTAGIITGSMWAASSWGRYWGWDPKEVWSLVALLGYLTILHTRLARERLPAWIYVIGAALTVFAFVMIGKNLISQAPDAKSILMTSAALAGALVGIAFLVLARGPFATAVKSILCFWMILMTYVGVNYVLGIGLHSYGFGTGAVARKMLWFGGADLGLMTTLGILYLARKGVERSDSTVGAARLSVG